MATGRRKSWEAMMVCRILFIAAVIFAVHASAAQLEIVVEPLSEDAQKCGIDEAALTARGRLALRAGGVQAVSDATGYLYINVSALSFGAGGCAANVDVAVVQPATLQQGAEFRKHGRRFVSANVCSKGAILSGTALNFSSRIENEIERLTKNCLGSLDYK